MADPSDSYHPLEVRIPPVPQDQIFNDLQWASLLALADTVIPSIRAPSANASPADKHLAQSQFDQAVATLTVDRKDDPNARALATQYLNENASSCAGFRDGLQRLFATYVHQEGRNGISLILTALNTRAGSLILTGSPTPFQNQPFEFRDRVFRGWETSRLPPLRVVYRALTGIFKRTWLTFSPTVCPVVGFPRVPVHGTPQDSYPYEFIQIPPGDQPEVIETDVVVVGSGCGGSVAAKNLAEAGHRVIVLEKSYQFSSRHFPMSFNEGFVSLFEAAGATASDDGSIGIFAGSTWGGGGTVNWSAALQTQGFVRQEWADRGLPFFTSNEFQKSLDRVCDRMGVGTEATVHNHQNRMVLEGARKLGYSAKAVPQNTGGTQHYCGHCTMGCHSCGKKGPTETFLVDAAKAGARFLEGFNADKVQFTQTRAGRVASGVEGTWTSRDCWAGLSGEGAVRRKVIVKAKKVVVSCGTLNSPLLLLRSGLKNPQIGRNLHLHPVALAGAVFEEETRPWEGAALTSVVEDFEDLDGKGHGVKVETLTMMPPAFLPAMPWRDGLQYKLLTGKLSHMAGFITLTKDRDTGRVYPDSTDGRIRVDYTPSPFDRRHIIEGLVASAKIAYISGAKEFHTSLRDMRPFVREDSAVQQQDEGANNAALQAWIAELRAKAPLDPERALFASAHQMGTCRMSATPKTGVVDAECQVWGTKGLYVLDASVFPSASGVNPMVTNMGIAEWASGQLAAVMKEEGRKSTKARL